MHRAIAATVGLLISGQVPLAIACSIAGPPPTDEELFRKASSVFVARVVRTEESSWKFGHVTEPIVEGDFQVIEVLKGQPPTDGKVRDLTFGPGNCSLGLLAGMDYLFFIEPNRHNFVLWPTGSRMIFNRQLPEVVEFLERLRNLK
jgi:hypothetical protein